MRELAAGWVTSEHLCPWWEPSMCCLHSPQWWQRHWQRSGVVDVLCADTLPDGWRAWLDWQRTASPDNGIEIEALEADHGSNAIRCGSGPFGR